MAKLLVNVRRKGRGFAGSSLRKIANKLCKTANRRTATNRSKVITREIRPSVITLEGEENRRGSGETGNQRKAEKSVRSSRHAVKLCEFSRTKSSYSLSTHRECNLETSARDSITLPTILTFTLLSVLSVFTETLVPFKLSSSSFLHTVIL